MRIPREPRRPHLRALAIAIATAPLMAGCTTSSAGPAADAASPDGTVSMQQTDTGIIPLDALAPDADAIPEPGTFCSLPGSLVATQQGDVVMPGDAGSPDSSILSWVTVPVGFCAHYFANVAHVRQLRFAPDGDLFAASPSAGTAGGSADVPASGGVLVLPDDNHDGVADSQKTFITLSEVQGLAFHGGNFYFQDATTIFVVPLAAGQRELRDGGAPANLTTITAPQASEHWPKNLDFAQDGTFYITNGSSQSQECTSSPPAFGAVFKASALTPGSTNSAVAWGFRNPIALRCETNHDVCLVAELSLDGSGGSGGREKLVPVRQGDNWGYPCCATTYLPFEGATFTDLVPPVAVQPSDCATVSAENVAFDIGHTPFGIDFETGRWPAPWTGRAFVTLHGDVGSWLGARVAAIALDPQSGLPLPASELDASSNGDNLLDFATGWDDGKLDHGRPAPVAFAPDGRMFVGNDWNGDVFWMAPIGLRP
jgi:glucose/arabinose dehydrogenase